MEYNKNINNNTFVKSNGRKLVSSGPRQAQERLKKLSDQQNISFLLEQIDGLKRELLNKPPQVSDDLLVEEINKAVKETRSKYEQEIKILNSKIIDYEKIIKIKDETIEILRTTIETINTGKPINNNRPEIDTPVVDPVEGKSTLESHIKTSDDILNTNMESQVNKLKSILGKKVI